jgi:hypothetical protein
MPRDEVLAVLRRVGMQRLVADAERELPDPVGYEELRQFCARHGVQMGTDWFISRMGGSP